MSTTLRRETCIERRPSKTRIRRSLTAEERFAQRTDYPLFGAVVGTRKYIAPDKLSDVAFWIAQRLDAKLDKDSLDRMLAICGRMNPSWFLAATAIRLDRASRELQPGVYIFHSLSNFSRIVDMKAPPSVAASYAQAIMDHQDREFMYLEPLWKIENGVRTPTTPGEFKELVVAQQDALYRMIPMMRMSRCIERIVWQPVENILTGVCIAVAIPYLLLRPIVTAIAYIPLCLLYLLGIKYFAKMKERHALQSAGLRVRGDRLQEMTLTEAARTLFLPISASDLEALASKWDPIIVFSVPELTSQFGGEIPLGLVAHWG